MLLPGQSTEIQGSGSKPYVIKNHDGIVWSCTCPGWRNCKGPLNTKTCKHTRQINGAANEAARIGQAAAPAPATASAAASQGKATATPRQAAPTITAGQQTAEQMVAAFQAAGPNKYFNPMVGAVRDQIEAVKAAELGRALRQDEKTKLFGPPVLLANSLDETGDDDLDPTGWWYSEKLDGVRAYWNGEVFVTRQGHIYEAPAWFTNQFPNHPLDGELWMGRHMFQSTISVVKSGPSERWRQVCYMVFDVPHLQTPFEDRIAEAGRIAKTVGTPWIKCLQHGYVTSFNHLKAKLDEIAGADGEGVMIRKPKSLYEPRRSSTLLKVKPFKDAEATIIGHTPGKGSNKGLCGGLEVKMPNGKTFCVGTGLKAADRRNPPPIGATITYRYTELTKDGIPKCGSFVCVRDYE